MDSIAPAVWAVGGVLEILDFGPSSPCNSSLSVGDMIFEWLIVSGYSLGTFW